MELERIRNGMNLNQKQMAKIIGISTSYYYKIEAGYRFPSYSFLKKFKKAFPNILIDDVFFCKEK